MFFSHEVLQCLQWMGRAKWMRQVVPWARTMTRNHGPKKTKNIDLYFRNNMFETQAYGVSFIKHPPSCCANINAGGISTIQRTLRNYPDRYSPNQDCTIQAGEGLQDISLWSQCKWWRSTFMEKFMCHIPRSTEKVFNPENKSVVVEQFSTEMLYDVPWIKGSWKSSLLNLLNVMWRL